MNKKWILLGIIFTVIVYIFIMKPEFYTLVKNKVFVDSDKTGRDNRIAGFPELADKVMVKKDITYSNKYENSLLDIYIPKENAGKPKPVIFWAHGGAFIAGDKKNVSDYSVMLASQGYVVVNINYSLAPKYEYPTPVIQIGDAYKYIAARAEKYDVEVHKAAFGGDSAGGQIIGQFVNIQVDDEYAKMLGIEPVVKSKSIKAVMFFSALLDINKYNESEKEYANQVYDRSAQAYFGMRNWKHSDKVNQANIVGNVNNKFPPTYLTDGNTRSFQPQAEQLAKELKKQDVPVETTFFPKEQAELLHQYQFKMRTEEAQINYKEVSSFLGTYLK